MKKEIHYTDHLIFRMKIRNIEYHMPREIYKKAKERYYDSDTRYYIAIGGAYYKNKFREMAVVYEETNNKVKLITIPPLKQNEKLNKIKSRRWIKK